MALPAVTVEALPAGYGDSVLITCALGTGVWRLLVDTGPDECWPSLQQRLEQIPADLNGKRHIDLAVISHIDHDHIGAARALFDDRSLGLTFGDIWVVVNGGKQMNIWFNYRNDHTAKWDASELRERYRYAVGLPEDGQGARRSRSPHIQLAAKWRY